MFMEDKEICKSNKVLPVCTVGFNGMVQVIRKDLQARCKLQPVICKEAPRSVTQRNPLADNLSI